MTRAELRHRLSHGELLDWMAFYELEAKQAEKASKNNSGPRRRRRG